jgi:hypothetical protein
VSAQFINKLKRNDILRANNALTIRHVIADYDAADQYLLAYETDLTLSSNAAGWLAETLRLNPCKQLRIIDMPIGTNRLTKKLRSSMFWWPANTWSGNYINLAIIARTLSLNSSEWVLSTFEIEQMFIKASWNLLGTLTLRCADPQAALSFFVNNRELTANSLFVLTICDAVGNVVSTDYDFANTRIRARSGAAAVAT